MLHALEEATIRAFMDPAKRDRLLTLLASAKRRKTALNSLNHFTHWDHRFARELGSTEDALAVLIKSGAGQMCHLISDSRELDGCDRPLADAVAKADACSFASVICCNPAGQVAMFFDEMEAPRTRLLLQRKS